MRDFFYRAVTVRRMVRTVAILSAVLWLAGCGKKDDAGPAPGITEVEFWHYQSGPQGTAIDELLRQFEKANPDIRVRSAFQGNPGQLKQKLDGSFASGTNNNPAVSLVYENWADDFLARGYLDPVENHFDGPDGLSEEDRKDFVTAFLDGNSWDGKLVTLPFNKSIYLFHINADSLHTAGFTTAPATQHELVEFVRKATTRQGNKTTAYGMGVMPKGEAMTTLMLAAGGAFTDEAGKPTLNSPQALAALELLKALQYPDRYLYVSPDYMSIPFSSRLIASFIYSSASLPYNAQAARGKFTYVAAPVPAVEGATPRYLLQGTNIAMFANKSEQERAAAWKLIRFLTMPANAAYFCSRSGYMPYRYSILQQPEFQKYLAENPAYALGARLVLEDKGMQEPKVRAWEGIRTEIDTVVDKTLARPDSNPRALLDELQRKAEQKMK